MYIDYLLWQWTFLFNVLIPRDHCATTKIQQNSTSHLVYNSVCFSALPTLSILDRCRVVCESYAKLF